MAFTLSVDNKPIMLSVVMLSVILLSVVAPFTSLPLPFSPLYLAVPIDGGWIRTLDLGTGGDCLTAELLPLAK